MSTSCELARMTPNGLQVAFVHRGGSRSYMEPMLATFYNDPAKVDILFNRGDLLVLHKEPIITPNYNMIRNVQSRLAYNSLCYFFDCTVSFNEIGLEDIVGNKYYKSLEDYSKCRTSFEELYIYDYNKNCWYYGDRNKKMHICKKNNKEAAKNVTYQEIMKYIQDDNYEGIKSIIDYNAPVQCHISRKPENGKYYLTLGSRKFVGMIVGYDIKIPRQDTKQVIARCNTLQELFQATVNVLLSL